MLSQAPTHPQSAHLSAVEMTNDVQGKRLLIIIGVEMAVAIEER
jgi:hypothetical protein